MPKTDKEFALLAISMKYLTQEQAEECLRLVAKANEMGLSETLPEVLIKKGYLNRAQEAAITQALNQPRISHIGKYTLIARIGQGGMGTVYKARQESLDKVVAVKVMAPRLARQRDFVERFIREAQASGRLNHPNIVQAIDAGEADGYYYFAMEYVDGENLRNILERDGKLSERRSLEICAAIATALEHAHKHNIVHRDIKPDNIFIAKDGTPKLGDLGLAKEIRTDKAITQAGIPVGTPYYISPEQVRGQEDIDGRADIYALGATLYRMVAGDVPYDGPTGAVVMTKHLNDPIPDPRKNSPQLSEDVVSIIHHCMQKKRDDRYRNARQLLDDIEAALAGKPLRHATKPQLRAAALADRLAQRQAADAATKRKLLIGGAAAAVVVLLVVLFAVLGRKGEQPPAQASAPAPKTATPPPRDPKETRKAPPPRTSTPTKVAAKPDAKVVLQELTAFARDSEDRSDIEKRLTDFTLTQYPGTPEAAQARAILTDLKARWKAEDDFKASLLDHIAQHRFPEARAALQDPPLKEKTQKTKAMLDDLAAQLARAEASYVASEASKGEELIRQGDLAAAKALFEGLAKLGLPEAVEASKAALPKIADLVAAREQRAAQREFAAAVVQAAPLVGAGKFQEARAVFDPARAGTNKALADLLAAGQSDVDRIAALFEDVTRELAVRAANKGRALVKGIGRPIAKVEDGILHSTLGGSFPIAQLRTVDLDRDEYNCLKGKKVLLGLVELYRGDCEAAKGLFGEHAPKPPDADTARWLRQLEWVEAIAKEGQAAELLAEAGRLAEQGKWKEASDALARLGDQFGNTACVEKNRAAIGDLNKRVADAIAATVRKDEAIRPFIDITEKAGDLAKAVKTFKPVGGWVMDIDNDGMLDIAFDIRRKPGDSPLVPVFRNETKPGGEIVFRDITEQAGIDTGDEPICWADLDGDGDLDVVCRGLWSGAGAARQRDPKKLALYENVGKGTPMFRLDPARCLVPEIAKAGAYANYGFANIGVLDANGDGRPDIFGEYVGPFRTLILFGSVRGKPFVFDDVTEQVGFLVKKGSGFEAPSFLAGKAWPQYVVFDCDGDDLQDILYNSDGPILLRNGGRRGFSAVPAAALSYETYPSPATGNSPLIIPAVADYNNDGKTDIFVPQAQAKNLLMQGQGDGTFKDALSTTGPMATDKNDSLWATWGDVNNDGLPDLFVCNASERNRLYIQKGNHAFADKADEYGTTGERGEKTNFALFADFDRDGDLDMIVLRDNGRSQLLLNPFVTGQNRYYVSVLVRAPLGALGAKVTLYRLPDQVVGFQQVCRVEGYNRQTPREAFFGVATAGEYGVKVVLSNGTVIRQRLTIKPDSRNEVIIGREAR